jgi:hypothetical protein
MAFPAPVSASPIAVLVDRDAIRAAVGRDVSGDATASMIEAAIIEGIVAVALAPAEPPMLSEGEAEVQVDVEIPSPAGSRWHTAALAVALAASIVLMILAG